MIIYKGILKSNYKANINTKRFQNLLLKSNLLSFKNKIKTLFKILFGWMILVPISFLIPKKKNLIVVIGTSSKYFRDNSKYMYIHLKDKQEYKTYFLTEDKKLSDYFLKDSDI